MTTRKPGPFSLLGLLAGDSYECGLSKISADKYPAAQLRGDALPHSGLLRDLGVASATGGGSLASTELAAVAAAVRPLLVLDQLGAQRIEVAATGQLDLPRFDGGVGSWIGEGQPSASMTATTVKSAAATPHCGAARLALSRRVRNANRNDVEGAVLREVEAAVRNVIEQGFINGSGSSSEPLGLLRAPGIGSKAYAGAVPTHAELCDQIGLLAAADGDISKARFLLNPAAAAALMQATVEATSGQPILQWVDGAFRVAGVPVAISSNVPSGKYILGDFSTVQQIYFGAPQIVEDRFSNGRSLDGSVELVVMNFVDVVLQEPAFIVVGSF